MFDAFKAKLMWIVYVYIYNNICLYTWLHPQVTSCYIISSYLHIFTKGIGCFILFFFEELKDIECFPRTARAKKTRQIIRRGASALVWSGVLICIVQLSVALVLSTFLRLGWPWVATDFLMQDRDLDEKSNVFTYMCCFFQWWNSCGHSAFSKNKSTI